MGFRLVYPTATGFSRLKGRTISVRQRGWITFSDDLVKELGLTARSAIAVYINEDTVPHILAFQVASEGNPMARPFTPRDKYSAGHIRNIALMAEKVAQGVWDITGKQDDIYLTNCPCGTKGKQDEVLDVVEEPVVKAKRKYTRRAK